jgi:glycosyltransferase involved in cell wall biosynthesis
MPAVSVVIPAYNRRGFLAQTLASVRAQAYPDREIIVVDDASTDGTEKWIAGRKIPDLRFFRFRDNRGPAAARNKGVQEARGEFIAILDSDDLWTPDCLSSLMPAFRDRRIMAAFSNIDRMDAAGRVRLQREMRKGPYGLFPPPISGSIVRREAIARVGGFDPGFKRNLDDVDFFVRLALRYGPKAFRLVDRSLLRYREHPVQVTRALISFMTDARLSGSGPDASRSPLDLTYLIYKHERWLRPLLDGRRRFPLPGFRRGGWGIFELALLRHVRAMKMKRKARPAGS